MELRKIFSFLRLRKGFTLIELLISTAIFVVTVIGLITIFTVITSIQVKESGTAEVNQQAQFLQAQIQYYVQNARLVDMPADSAASTLKLRESNLSADPTYIYASSSVLYLKQTDSGTPTPLTSSKVQVSNLSFTRHYQIASSTAVGNESVSYSFTISGNTVAQNNFSQTVQSSVQVLGTVGPVTPVALIQQASNAINGTNKSNVTAAYTGANAAGDLLVAVVADSGMNITPFINVGASFKAQSGQTIALSQHDSKDNVTQSSSTSKSFPRNVTSSDLLVALVTASETSTIASVTDTLGNTWVQAVQTQSGGDTIGLFYTVSSAGGADNVTSTLNSTSTSGQNSLSIYEYSGAQTSAPLDSTSSALSDLATPTSTQSNDLVVGGLYCANGKCGSTSGGGTPPNGRFTQEYYSTSFNRVQYEDVIWPAAGTTYVNWNADGNPSVSDTLGNTWTKVARVGTVGDPLSAAISVFAAANAINGTTTVTATFQNGQVNYPSLFLYEYRGVGTALTVDGTSAQVQFGNSTPSSGFVNPQGNTELLLGVSQYKDLIDTWTAGPGYTMRSSSTVSGALAEDKIAYITQPVDASWSINNARSTLDLVVAINYSSGGSAPPVNFIQSESEICNGGATSTTCDFGFGGNTHAGNAVIVALRLDSTSTPVTVTDTAGNAYTLAASQNLTSDSDNALIYYATNIAGGADTVHVSSTVSVHTKIGLFEYRGVATSSPVDVTVGNQAGSGTALSTGNATTTNAHDLAFALFVDSGSNTFTPMAGWTGRENTFDGPTGYAMVEDNVFTSTSSINATATMLTSHKWAGLLATFKAAN